MAWARSAALFLDRDGTLIEDRGHLRSPQDVRFFPDTVAALRRLQRRFKLFIVTNQSGIATGLVSRAEVDDVNCHVVATLAAAGVVIEQLYCCPHQRSDACACIKPNPHFLDQAAAEHGIDLARSWVVGDHVHDVELGQRSGCAGGVYLLTGHGEKHLGDLPAGFTVLPNILDAAEWILDQTMFIDWQRRKGAELTAAARLLATGGVVAFPTETVYGLGASAWDPQAAARVFEIKRRPAFDPLIVHIATPDWLPELVESVPDTARELIRRFWPGPLTLVLPKTTRVPDIITSGLPTVAVRMPRHPIALELIRQAGVPVAAPSANRFGCISPTAAGDVRRQLGSGPDAILPGGRCRIGVESTIIDLSGPRPVLLRPGGVSAAELARVLGEIDLPNPHGGKITSPGSLPRHYAPSTTLCFAADHPRPVPGGPRLGLISFTTPPERDAGYAAVEVLSRNGSLREAAANLFAAMHRLDAAGLDLIVVAPLPGEGLATAINDRLRRASHPEEPG